MFRQHTLSIALSTSLAGAIALPAFAGVQSLTSDEMVDTYVKDSAIILVPRDKRKSATERQKVLRSLTISPGEPVVSESEELAYEDALRRHQEENKEDALEQAQEEFLRRAILLPMDELAQIQPPADFTPQLAPIVFGQQLEIPDEPFNQTFLNDQLSIGYDGQNVNFSIGNPPGIDRIEIPQAINEGPIQLTPRPGGGFDLSIAVPNQ
ncbi:hypothetical protein [Marinobacter caseinilyticus]|uniref:hypothetical protein n=1 Tax=Marinobacter caseinilyticus TaxID=2692195 RepID=UPI00140C6D9F|nr:hypothetical protein [Marinobacter caseinilyticus]